MTTILSAACIVDSLQNMDYVLLMICSGVEILSLPNPHLIKVGTGEGRNLENLLKASEIAYL